MTDEAYADAIERATQVLTELLADGPRSMADILATFGDDRVFMSTLREAMRRLRLQRLPGTYPSVWQLPAADAADDA